MDFQEFMVVEAISEPILLALTEAEQLLNTRLKVIRDRNEDYQMQKWMQKNEEKLRREQALARIQENKLDRKEKIWVHTNSSSATQDTRK